MASLLRLPTISVTLVGPFVRVFGFHMGITLAHWNPFVAIRTGQAYMSPQPVFVKCFGGGILSLVLGTMRASAGVRTPGDMQFAAPLTVKKSVAVLASAILQAFLSLSLLGLLFSSYLSSSPFSGLSPSVSSGYAFCCWSAILSEHREPALVIECGYYFLKTLVSTLTLIGIRDAEKPLVPGSLPGNSALAGVMPAYIDTMLLC